MVAFAGPRRFRIGTALVMAGGLLTIPLADSRAEIGSLGQVAGWEIDVDPDQEICSMTTDSGPDGQDSLSLVETPDQTMSVIASSDTWDLGASSQMPVTLAIGASYSLKSTGYTTDDGVSLIVVLGDDHRFLKAIADGRRLNVSVDHTTLSFRLTGAERALGAVAACLVNLKSGGGGEDNAPPTGNLSL